MKTVDATPFCKQATCPNSETLLAFGTSNLGHEEACRVDSHLATCDFCSAEVQLLAECPQTDEVVSPIKEIPVSLRRLAEELLAGSLLTPEMFAEAGFEKERLTLTDA